MKASLRPDYFADVYQRSKDPWEMATSPYEREKYEVTVAALPRAHFRNALEIGCAVGVLSSMIAPRCQSYLGVDVNDRALQQARERCKEISQVRFDRVEVPHAFPEGAFDLILVSEVAYYWSPADLARAQDEIGVHLEPGGALLLVHWTPVVPDYPITGDEAHESFLKRSEFSRVRGERHEKYRLDLLVRH